MIKYLKSRWQLCTIGLIGLYFILIAFIFTPFFIEKYIIVEIELNETLIHIVQNLRITVFVLGLLVILFGIISEKWPALFSRSNDTSEWSLFNYSNIFIIVFSFLIIFTSLHIIVKLLRTHIQFSTTYFWPISNFLPQIPDFEHLFVAVIIVVTVYFFIKYLIKPHSSLLILILFSILLVMSTNLLQIQGWEGNNLIKNDGWDAGFVVPVTGSSKNTFQYYHDAINITDVIQFINNFEQIQPKLLLHTKTHPPGAVLTIYLLLKLFGSPVMVSIIIGIISVSLSTFFLYEILSIEFEEDLSKYMTFLFVLIPSIQIYYVASIDALIATFLLGSLYFHLKKRSAANMIGSIVFLFLASFLTFIFIFILPVMIGYEIVIRKDFLRSGIIISGLGLIYVIIYIIFNFNYINSFMIASALENPHGFRLVSQPVTYFFTRLEGICEMIFYFGPFLSLLAALCFHVKKRINSNLLTLTWLAILSLLAILGAGALRSGEAARAALFLYPYLMFPVAIYLQEFNISLMDKKILLYLVFAQTILMQMFGFYFW